MGVEGLVYGGATVEEEDENMENVEARRRISFLAHSKFACYSTCSTFVNEFLIDSSRDRIAVSVTFEGVDHSRTN